jgi:fusaric acid resistance family protein
MIYFNLFYRINRDPDRPHGSHRDHRPLLPSERPAHRRLRSDRTLRLRSRTAGWNRAYAAVLSGYRALVAIQQIDTPEHIFETGMARGAAMAVGTVAVAVVNDFLAAPDSFPQLASHFAALHRRVRDYAKAVLRDEATDAATAETDDAVASSRGYPRCALSASLRARMRSRASAHSASPQAR